MPPEEVELPPIPEGDESKDTKVFRFVGRGGRYRKYECWEDAVHEYAKSYALLAVKQERERLCDQLLAISARWDGPVRELLNETLATLRKG